MPLGVGPLKHQGFPCPKPPRRFPVLCPALLPVASGTSLLPDATRSISARTWDETRSGPAEKAAGAMRVHPWGLHTRHLAFLSQPAGHARRI